MINEVEWIRDVIYDYIYFTKSKDHKYRAEKDIIDSVWFQRLRRILQLQSSWMVFPNAVHNRFLHSLGTMHLAGQLAGQLYPYFKKAFPGEYIPEEKNYVIEVFRLAGLLHDIGHAPLGHLIDEIYTYKFFNKTHEDISCKIIIEEMGDIIKKIRLSPFGAFEKEIDPELVIKFIKMPNNFKGFKLWEQVFSKIMFGIYNVDSIDFLLRDKYFTGMKEVGEINYVNLFNQSFITNRGLTLKKSALPTLRSFLTIRLSMFKNVYYNEKKIIIEKSLARFIPEIFKIIKINNPFENLNKFLLLDDFSLMTHIRTWSTEKKGIKKSLSEEWLKIFDTRDIQFKTIFEKEKYIYKSLSKEKIMNHDELKSKIKKILKDKEFIISQNILDVRNKNLFLTFGNKEDLRKFDNIRSIGIYNENTEKFLDKEAEHLMEDIPLKYFILHIFADKSSPIDSLQSEKFEDEQLKLHLKNSFLNEQNNKTEITNI